MAGKKWSKAQHAKYKATVAARNGSTRYDLNKSSWVPRKKDSVPAHGEDYTALAEAHYAAIKLLAEVLRSLPDEKLVEMVKR